MDHTTIPFQISMQNAGQVQTMKYQRDRMNDMLTQADEMAKTMATMQRMYGLMTQLADQTHRMVNDTVAMQQITNELRDHIADFDDFWRPIRSYFYWEKHCFDIPICWSLRSIFDGLDGLDAVDEKLNILVGDIKNLDLLMPQMLSHLPADDRNHGQHAGHDAHHAQHHVRHLRPDGRDEPERQCHGEGFRHR